MNNNNNDGGGLSLFVWVVYIYTIILFWFDYWIDSGYFLTHTYNYIWEKRLRDLRINGVLRTCIQKKIKIKIINLEKRGTCTVYCM